MASAAPTPAPLSMKDKAKSSVKFLLKKARSMAPPSPYITIGSEKVYFGDNPKYPVQFKREYAAEITDAATLQTLETLFKLAFRNGTFQQPEDEDPICDEAELDLIKKALFYRFQTLRQQSQKTLDKRGDTIYTRQILGHILELKEIIRQVEEAQEACKSAAAEAEKAKLPLAIEDRELHSLVRKFAFLMLHSQYPIEGQESYTEVAKNIIQRLDAIQEPSPGPNEDDIAYGNRLVEFYTDDMNKFYQEYPEKDEGAGVNPLLENILRMGLLGVQEFLENNTIESFGILFENLASIISADEFLSDETKQYLLGNFSDEDPRNMTLELIMKLLNALKECNESEQELEGRVHTLEAELAECKKLVQSLKIERDRCQRQFTALKSAKAGEAAEEIDARVADAVAERDATIAQAQAAMEEVNGRLQTATDTLAARDRELAECRSQLRSLGTMKGSLDGNLAKLAAEIEALKSGAATKDARINELEGLLETKTAAVATAEKAVAAASLKSSGMEAELTAFKSRAPADEAAAAETAKKIAQLESALAAAQQATAARQAELTAAKAEADKLRLDLENEKDNVRGLQAKEGELEGSVASLTKARDEAMAKASLTEADVAAQKKIVGELQAQVAQEKAAAAKVAEEVGSLRNQLTVALGKAAELEGLRTAKEGVNVELAKLKEQLAKQGDAYKALEESAKQQVADAEKACLARIEKAKQEVLAAAQKELAAARAGSSSQVAALSKELEQSKAATTSAKSAGEAALATLRAQLLEQAATQVAEATKAAEAKAALEIGKINAELTAKKNDIVRLMAELEEAKKSGDATLQKRIEELTKACEVQKGQIKADAEKALAAEVAKLKGEHEKTLAAAIAKEKTEGAGSAATAVAEARAAAETEYQGKLAALQTAAQKAKEEALSGADTKTKGLLAEAERKFQTDLAAKEAALQAEIGKVAALKSAAAESEKQLKAQLTVETGKVVKAMATAAEAETKFKEQLAAAIAEAERKSKVASAEAENKFKAQLATVTAAAAEAEKQLKAQLAAATAATEKVGKDKNAEIARVTAEKLAFVNQVKATLEDLNAKHAKLQDDYNRREKEFAAQLPQAVAAKEAAVRKELGDKYAVEKAALDKQIKEARAAALEAAGNVTALAQKKGELEAELDGLKKEVGPLREAKFKLDAKITELSKALTFTQGKFEAAEAERKRLDDENFKLKNRVEAIDYAVKKATKEIEADYANKKKELEKQKEIEFAALKQQVSALGTALAGERSVSEEARRKQAEKLRAFADEVLRGEYRPDKYQAAANDKPLADIMTRLAASSAAVPKAVGAPPPVLPSRSSSAASGSSETIVASKPCTLTHTLAIEPRGQRVQFSDFMARLFSNPPYCFREEHGPGDGHLRTGQTYNYKKFIQIINMIHASQKELKAPPGFAKDVKYGTITPEEDRGLERPDYFLDLRHIVARKGGGETRSKKPQGKRQTRKKTARNRR